MMHPARVLMSMGWGYLAAALLIHTLWVVTGRDEIKWFGFGVLCCSGAAVLASWWEDRRR